MSKPRKFKLGELAKQVPKSRNFSELTRNLGCSIGSRVTVKNWCRKLDLDTSHFESRSDLAKRTIVASAKERQPSLESVMVENSSYSRTNLKRRLLKEGFLKEECCECGQGVRWRGKRLPMILDHINGINNDHRFRNLRLLCPNCSFTLDTYGSRNWKNVRSTTLKARYGSACT